MLLPLWLNLAGGGAPVVTVPATIAIRDRPWARIRVAGLPFAAISINDHTFTRARVMADFDIYNVDDVAVFTLTFTTATGLTDPSTLVVDVKRLPGGTPETFTYGSSPELVKSSVGVYKLNYPCTTSGSYAGHVKSTGAAAGGEDFYFDVRANPTA